MFYIHILNLYRLMSKNIKIDYDRSGSFLFCQAKVDKILFSENSNLLQKNKILEGRKMK